MKQFVLFAAGLLSLALAQAASVNVPIYLVTAQGIGQPLGNIKISETPYGLLFTPVLTGLPAGIHGFHVHENGSCAPAEKDGKAGAALQAGGHYDPQKTSQHLGPYANGHLGDLPVLYVGQDGQAMTDVLAPRLKKLTQISGRALMAGGDNHADHPQPLGGGGARIACGVIP